MCLPLLLLALLLSLLSPLPLPSPLPVRLPPVPRTLGGLTAPHIVDTVASAAEKEDEADTGLLPERWLLLSDVMEDDLPDRWRVPLPLLGLRPNHSCSGGIVRDDGCPFGVDSPSKTNTLLLLLSRPLSTPLPLGSSGGAPLPPRLLPLLGPNAPLVALV